MDLEEFYKIYIKDSKKKGWNYMYSKKMVKQKVNKINTLNQQINEDSTIDGKILLDEEIKKILGEFDTEPILKKGIERTNKGKIVERVKIIQKQQRGNFTPLHSSPLRKSILKGGLSGGPNIKGPTATLTQLEQEKVEEEEVAARVAAEEEKRQRRILREAEEKEMKEKGYWWKQVGPDDEYSNTIEKPCFDTCPKSGMLDYFRTPKCKINESGKTEPCFYSSSGGRKKRGYGGKSPKRTKKKKRKSLFKKKRTKKKKRKSSKRTKRKTRRGYGGPSPKTYKKCAKFFTKKHKITQKKALKMCKVMFG